MKNPRLANTGIFPALSFAFKLLIGIVIISPLLLGVSYSFMSLSEMASIPPRLIPRSPVIYTYRRVFTAFPLFRFMFNSFVVCAIVITAQFFTCSLAAYAFAFHRFKGERFIFFLILSTFMIPADTIIIANFLTITRIRLEDSYAGLVAPYLTGAMGIFLMRQFFLTIPRELQEAAVIDGCRDLRFLFLIVLPVSKPALASLGVYTFISVYNQYLWPLLVTNTDRMRTVQVGIGFLRAEEAVDYGIVLAGAALVLIPAVIVFITGQRYLVSGMTEGAVKG
ncbi:MAG: carbohydrate ABC transporter permease [Treponema sp.]|jgi:sn-glycerol 3-phosphate transport system permease protein|nr:carbohydrate ABC transporter permease [Treponema sp.]